MESKRTQASRTAATRAALVAAARPLFAERGFAAVGTDEIARAAVFLSEDATFCTGTVLAADGGWSL